MNAFEIRAELIAQSTEYLKQQHALNTEFARKTFDQLLKQGDKVQADYKEYMPAMFTFDDVIDKATKLYGFVKDAK